MTDILTAVPAEALSSEWALYIIGGLGTAVVAMAGFIGVVFFKKFDVAHKEAMEKLDKQIEGTLPINEMLTHVKETKYKIETQSDDILEIKGAIVHTNQGLKDLNKTVKHLADKVKCPITEVA